MKDDNYTNVILEDINGKFDAVMEYVKDIPEIKTRLTNLETDVAQIKDDMSLVKNIATDHEERITVLEQAS